MSAIEKLKDRFNSLDPDKRRKTVLIGGTVGFLVLMSAIVLINDDTGTRRDQQERKESDVGNIILTPHSRDLGLEGISSEFDTFRAEMKDQLDSLREENIELKNQIAATEVAGGMQPDQALQSLSDDVGNTRNSLSGPPGTMFNNDRPTGASREPILPSQRTQGPIEPPPPPPVAPEITTVRSEKPKVSAAVERMRNVYLPTSSIMTGVMLNGLDAPTGRMAQSSPIPVVIRVKHDAILPSQYRSDVREAFILAAGFGDLSSERAYLRAERFSMVLNNGEIIDIPIKMSAVGNDGKSGLRGRVVSKQGAVIGQALLAGMADGVSRAFGNRSVSFGGDGNLPSDSDVMVGGIGGGTTGALDRIAAYFLQQAEAMYPVVEVDAGREVTFILLEGTELAPRVVETEKEESADAA